MHKAAIRSVDGTRQATIDVCTRCRSVFAEEFELKVLSDALAKLPFRDRPHAAVAAVVPGEAACPACGEALDKVPVSGVEVELCGGCHGVWLDGGELEALAQRSGAPAARDPYRASMATEALAAGVTRCAACESLVEVSATMLLPSGLVCATCFYTREEKRLEREGNRPLLAPDPRASEARANETHWPLAAVRDVFHAMSNQQEPWEVAGRPKPPPGPDARACDQCTAARGLIVLRGSAECPH